MQDSRYIRLCLEKIEDKLGWGPSEKWTERDFIRLQGIIGDVSKINISTHTLKRLFGKIYYDRDNYTPQEATKNALVIYLGYVSWLEFIQTNQASNSGGEPGKNMKRNILLDKISDMMPPKFYSRPLFFLLLFVFIIIMVIRIVHEDTNFFIENTSGYVPHTVTFHYHVPQRKVGNAYINYDFTHPHLGGEYYLTEKGENHINYTYQIPGVFFPELHVGKNTYHSGPVVVLSDDWISFYQNEMKNKVLWLHNIIKEKRVDNYLYLSAKTIKEHGGDTILVYYTGHRLIRDFGVSGDDFVLETMALNNSDIGGIGCYDVNLYVYCENSIYMIRMVEKQCHAYSLLSYGEKLLDGSTVDLPFITFNPADWSRIRLEVDEKRMRLLLNQEEIYSDSYSQACGNILGIQFFFKGSGKVDYVTLSTKQGEVIFHDDFGGMVKPLGLVE